MAIAVPERKYMTVSEFRSMTGLGKNTVYRLAEKNQLPGARKVGKRLLIARSAYPEMNGQEVG